MVVSESNYNLARVHFFHAVNAHKDFLKSMDKIEELLDCKDEMLGYLMDALNDGNAEQFDEAVRKDLPKLEVK